jgi:hypothetical protein
MQWISLIITFFILITPISNTMASPETKAILPTSAPQSATSAPAGEVTNPPQLADDRAKSPPAQADDQTSPDTILQQLSKTQDQSVQVNRLENGLLAWCQHRPEWRVVEMRFAIAAGSAHDPNGLHGRSRFVAQIFDELLNRPKNPAHSFFPPGGHRYKMTFDKDWVEIKIRFNSQQISVILEHLTQSIQQLPEQPISANIRSILEKTADSFPPPRLFERIDAYLFPDHARGQFMRGERNTFRSIQPFALQTAAQQLYQAYRIRLLLVGGVNCQDLPDQLKSTLGQLPSKVQEPLWPKTSLISPDNKNAKRSFLSVQESLSLYQLPALERNSYLPLYILYQVSRKELQHHLEQEFPSPFEPQSILRPYAHNGYIAFLLPSRPLQQSKLQQLHKKTLGRLQMKRYIPALEQRVQVYIREIQLQLQQLQESSAGTVALLWPQLLLPAHDDKAKDHPPIQLQPTLSNLQSSHIRELALLFMSKDLSISHEERPFSIERIALFIGTLILVWLLLDVTFRRSKKTDE